MATTLRLEDYPDLRENWPEARFEGGARSTITLKNP